MSFLRGLWQKLPRPVKFLIIGALTALLDNGIFYKLNLLTGARFSSLALATAVSVTFNYLASRSFIFEVNELHAVVLPKYLSVHGVGLLLRGAILEGLVALFHLPAKSLLVNVCKLGADGVVYSLKYFIQRDFVFKATRSAAPESDRSGLPGAPESIPQAKPQRSGS